MKEIDVERLLHWAFCDELSKKQISSAEGNWDKIEQDGRRGGIDPGYPYVNRSAPAGVNFTYVPDSCFHSQPLAIV
jgi:hypothetical protein